MKMPFEPHWLNDINRKVPNVVMAGVPGFEKEATTLMQQTVKSKGVASIDELRSARLDADADARPYPCQMTADLFGYSQDKSIPENAGWTGAASFLPQAQKSDVCLFI